MQNTFIHLTIFILLSSFGKLSHGQTIADFKDISIFFGDMQKSGSNVEDLMITKSGELLCIQNKLSFLNFFSRNNSKYSFDFITDYKLPETHPISFYGNGKKSSFTHYTILGDKILGVSSQTTYFNKKQKLYYHLIDISSQGKSNHGFSMNEYFDFNKDIDLSKITLVTSQDKKYASIIYTHEPSIEMYKNIGILNFKDGSANPQSCHFTFPFPTKEYEFLDFHIKDENNQYIVSGHFLEAPAKSDWVNKVNYYKTIVIGKITNKEFNYEKIEDEGRFYTEVGFYNAGDQIILSGLYSPFIDGKIEGVFTATINETGEIVNKRYTPFSIDVIASIAAYNLSFLNDQNTIKNEYIGFDIVEFYSTKEGYIGIAEFNALEYKYASADVPGATNTVDSYFWSNDIIVFKLHLNGDLDWNRIIPKYQRSINDRGYYLSNASYLSSDYLHLFFNDNQLNYDQDGDYNKNGDPPFAAQFNSGKHTIGHVSLRLSDGFINRKSTIGKEETNLLLVPLLSRSFTEKKKLMIYGRSGNRHKIGSISFRN